MYNPNRVKELREKLGMTQEELAHKLGYRSKSSVAHIENGRDIPRAMVEKLAKILKTTPQYLMGWENDSFIMPEKLSEIKKELPGSAKESDRERIVNMIADRLGECPEQDIDDMLTFLDFLDFRRRVD